VIFVIGGMTGPHGDPPADFVLQQPVFDCAPYNVAIGGVVFGVMAGISYWFPKAFGFTLNERLGKAVFWCWFFGFYLAFMPLYVLGLMGATRRMQHYSNTHWQPLMLVALAGALLILLGIALTVVQLAVSIRDRERNRDVTGDPWNGRTLEWSTPSPPPAWNFSHLPPVGGADAFWAMKQLPDARIASTGPGDRYPAEQAGFFLAFFAVLLGFSLIWRTGGAPD
jgi:cytochrome o ubiquinol oxidase subunit 1